MEIKGWKLIKIQLMKEGNLDLGLGLGLVCASVKRVFVYCVCVCMCIYMMKKKKEEVDEGLVTFKVETYRRRWWVWLFMFSRGWIMDG